MTSDHPTSRRSAVRLAVLAAAVVLQGVALYLPGQHGPSVSLPLDKVVHFALFAAVAAVAIWAGVPWPWAAAFLVLQAGLSEVVQHAVLPDRGGEPGDLVADLAGTAVGLVAGHRVVGRRSPT